MGGCVSTVCNSLPGGDTFALKHKVWDACGIPVEDTFVLTGGHDVHVHGDHHVHVTRWENSFYICEDEF